MFKSMKMHRNASKCLRRPDRQSTKRRGESRVSERRRMTGRAEDVPRGSVMRRSAKEERIEEILKGKMKKKRRFSFQKSSF